MELRAKKSLGQHFLNSPAALAKIIEAAHLLPGECVLEIGPGTGILTEALLKTGAHVVAIEKDDRAIGLLREKFAAHMSREGETANGRLDVIHGDALDVELSRHCLADGHYALVANIPYYVTGMILERFLEHAPRPNRMVLLVQKEVADRIAARNGKESILSISVKIFGTPRVVAKVPRGAFVPAPEVDSAILEISGISEAQFGDDERGESSSNRPDLSRFFRILKAGFAHKRKFLKNNLEAVLDSTKVDTIFQKLAINPQARAEDLAVATWIRIAALSCE